MYHCSKGLSEKLKAECEVIYAGQSGFSCVSNSWDYCVKGLSEKHIMGWCELCELGSVVSITAVALCQRAE